MLGSNHRTELRVDPWIASSLLQKAIRRGDGEIACEAAIALHRQRGKGIWKRLVTIAFEDVGIANPKLLLDVTSLANDESLRAAVGREQDLLVEISARLAESSKDRSGDYVYSAVTHWRPLLKEHAAVRSAGSIALMSVGSDNGQPLFRRAAAVLELATVDGKGEKLLPRLKMHQLFEEVFGASASNELLNATYLAAQMRAHPFVLMPLLVRQSFEASLSKPTSTVLAIEPAEKVDHVPLYAFDMFTALGKRAIGMFARECPQVRSILDCHCVGNDLQSAAATAVFYAEGCLVARQLCWDQAQHLEEIGRHADFSQVRTDPAATLAIIETVKVHLPELNQIRRGLLSAKGAR